MVKLIQKRISSTSKTKAEIDYERCKPLLVKLITQVCDHYTKHLEQTICIISSICIREKSQNEIYKQMMQHFYCENGFYKKKLSERNYNIENHYNFTDKKDYMKIRKNAITSTLCKHQKVFSTAKFDISQNYY